MLKKKQRKRREREEEGESLLSRTRNLERANETESIRKERRRTKGESERAGKCRAAFRWKPKKRIRFQLDWRNALAFTSNLLQQWMNFETWRNKLAVVSTSWVKKFSVMTTGKTSFDRLLNLVSFKLDKSEIFLHPTFFIFLTRILKAIFITWYRNSSLPPLCAITFVTEANMSK